MTDTILTTTTEDCKLLVVDSIRHHDHLGARSRKKSLAAFGGGYRFGDTDLSTQDCAFFFTHEQAEELYVLLSKAKELNWF